MDLKTPALQKNIEEIADQMCLAVKGDFDFIINTQAQDESIQKLTMLVNFLLDNARRALLDVKEKNVRLTELDKLKSDFMANISHELRTPLTLIMGPLETLSKAPEKYDSETRENLGRMQRNAGRLYTLVNDLLDFTKLEADKFTLQEEFIPIAQVISELVDDAQGLAKERQVTLHFSQTNEIGFLLFDLKVIEKITLNLLSNALKFTPKGGSIDVNLSQENDALQLTVSDTGIGISTEQIPHIFERFHQADTSSTRLYEGTGIGLALANQFVTIMGGKISVESKENKGTKFTVSLPARAPTDETQIQPITRIDSSLLCKVQKTAIPSPSIDETLAPKIKGELPLVLVVDDNADMQAYIASFLAPTFEIIMANNGKSALEMINKYKPQVVLSDVMMPIMDGHQLTKALKENPDTKNIPIILVTAKTGGGAVSDSLGIGADDYLPKPFSPEELIARTYAALRQHQEYLKNVELNTQLITLSRRAGMADIATSVLHNIGNVLNSVHVTVGLLKESASKPLYSNLESLSHIIEDNIENLPAFLTQDSKGKIVPEYLIALAKEINNERTKNVTELQRLSELVEHIEEIVNMQQSISGVSGVTEKIFLPDSISQAISMSIASIEKRDIEIRNQFKHNVFLNVDKSKLLQILVNLIQNATDALSAEDFTLIEKKILIDGQHAEDAVHIIVKDNGVGIVSENLTKIFSFGFTTKPYGHGFGLHSSALAAKELGGSLQAKSNGPGKGAEFILTLPLT